jgi:hypothetical protein
VSRRKIIGWSVCALVGLAGAAALAPSAAAVSVPAGSVLGASVPAVPVNGRALAVIEQYYLPAVSPNVGPGSDDSLYVSPQPPGTEGLNDSQYAPGVNVQYPHQDSSHAWQLRVNPQQPPAGVTTPPLIFDASAVHDTGSDQISAEVWTNYELDVPAGGAGTPQPYVYLAGLHSSAVCNGGWGQTSTGLDALYVRQPGGSLSPVNVPASGYTVSRLPFPPPEGEQDPANPHFGDLTVRRVQGAPDLLSTADIEPGYLQRAAGWRIDVTVYRLDAAGNRSDVRTDSMVLGAAAC